MNLWDEVNQELRAALAVLGPLADACPPMELEQVRREEERLRKALDSACLHWMERGQWASDLSPLEASLLTLRLHTAQPWVLALSLPDDWPHPSRQQALEWLLVQAWPIRAGSVWPAGDSGHGHTFLPLPPHGLN